MTDALPAPWPALLGPPLPATDARVRAERWDLPRVEAALASTAGHARAGHLRALALFWHDHLAASHEQSQALADAEGSYLHGMMHRREGDYGNAKYWFHRAGSPRIAATLRQAALALPGMGFLVPGGRWDPDAFVDCCAAGDARAVELQAVECRAWAQALLAAT